MPSRPLPLTRVRRGSALPTGRHRAALVLAAVASLGPLTACAPADDPELAGGASASPGCPGIAGETVRWIVPFTPGGGYDIYSRLIEPHYERVIGAEIVVENRTGATGRVGARTLRDAAPDGRTLGMVNGVTLLVDHMLDPAVGLHPVEDFTPIGRVALSAPVLFARRGSGLETWEAVRDSAARAPLVFGVGGVGSTGWTWSLLASEVLDLDVVQVSGYPGTREMSMALIRGEIDLLGSTYESVLDRSASGDLVPVLQVSTRVNTRHPALQGVPALVGPDGVAAQRALELGLDPAQRVARAEAVDRILGSGRLVLAPRDLDPDLASCLQDGLARVIRDPVFVEEARQAARSLSYGDPAELAAGLEAAQAEIEALSQVFRAHVAAARAGGTR